MEQIKRPKVTQEAMRRKERIGNFIRYIVHEASPELAYYCLSLDHDETGRNRVLNVILADRTDRANEFAIRLLRDQPHLTASARDVLLEHIVDLGDKTSCSLALMLVRDLGPWEERLQRALTK
jgi:hypothetical protein